MADTSALSLSGAKDEAERGKTNLANSVLHLFKFGFNPTATSTLADFDAQECDFDGYAPATIATWADPVLAGVAYAIFAPTQTFRWVFATGETNSVGGAYLVLADGTTLYSYQVFAPARPAQGPDQAVIVDPIDVYPAG